MKLQSFLVSYGLLPPFVPGEEKCQEEYVRVAKRRQVRAHMGMKEKGSDDVGFTQAGATSSCLYVVSSTDYLAQLTPLLSPQPVKLFPRHIRRECFPGKSERPWKSVQFSGEQWYKRHQGATIQGVPRRRLFGSWSVKLESAFKIFHCC